MRIFAVSACITFLLCCLIFTSCTESTGRNDLHQTFDNLYKSTVNQYRAKSYPEGTVQANRLVELADALDEEDKKAKASLLLASFYRKQSNIEGALTYFFKAYDNFKAIDNKKFMAESLKRIGLLCIDAASHELAHEYFDRELELREQLNDPKKIANAHYNIAVAERFLTNYDSAFNHLFTALKVYEEGGFHENQIQTHLELGLTFVSSDRFDEALSQYQQSLKLFETFSANKEYKARLYNDLGVVHANKGNMSEALEYYLQALEVESSINDPKLTIYTLNSLGDYYSEIDDSNKAITYYEQAISLEGVEKNIIEYKKALKSLVSFYRKERNEVRALDYSEKLITFLDRHADQTAWLIAQHKQEQIKNTTLEYQNAKLRQANLIKSNQNLKLIVGILLTLILLGVAAFLVFYFRKDRNEYKDLAGALKENYRENYLKVRELSQSQGQGD
ncbi:MAG: tetratricopeptide repeat protein [Bacteroidota bacterium]